MKKNPNLDTSGGRPPHSFIKDRIYEIFLEEFKKEEVKMGMQIIRSQEIMKLYKESYDKSPDLKTIKKYIQILCDEKKLKAVQLYDNNLGIGSRRTRHHFVPNIDMEIHLE